MNTLVFLSALLSSCALSRAEPPEAVEAAPPSQEVVYDARLSGVDYPFPVKTYAVKSQGQDLEMVYMDLEPAQPNGEAVVLLHGKNFSGAYWERTARALVDAGYRVVIPDQIGFGKSSKPVAYQYSLANMAFLTHGLLWEELGLERVAVVGHSMGGMVATRFALMYPVQTTELVLVNPIGLEDWSQVVPYQPVDVWYANELGKTPEKVQAYMQASYFDGNWEPAYDALAQLQMRWTESPDREQLAMVSALTYDMVFTQPVVQDFPRVQAPTTLIIGTRDRTALGKPFAPAEVRETMGRYEVLGKQTAEAIPNATLVELEGIGHIPQVEAWDAYIQALMGALEG